MIHRINEWCNQPAVFFAGGILGVFAYYGHWLGSFFAGLAILCTKQPPHAPFTVRAAAVLR
ncbi:MAG: hypothetical protein RSE54_03315 [Ruthenibacterium sp.]